MISSLACEQASDIEHSKQATSSKLLHVTCKEVANDSARDKHAQQSTSGSAAPMRLTSTLYRVDLAAAAAFASASVCSAEDWCDDDDDK